MGQNPHDGEEDPAEAWLSAGQAGESNTDRASAGGVALQGLGFLNYCCPLADNGQKYVAPTMAVCILYPCMKMPLGGKHRGNTASILDSPFGSAPPAAR